MNEKIIWIKKFHGTVDNDDLIYDNFYVHPGADLPEGCKIPKFERFDGIGNSTAQLRRYYDQMVTIRTRDSFLIHLIS